MSNVTPSPVRFGWVVSVVVYTFIAVGIAYAATDKAIGWIIPVALCGGVLMASVIVATRPRRSTTFTPDRFAGDMQGDVLNLARVRVSGIGGVGLLFVAGLVALQYQLILVAVVAGFLGGAIAAMTVILHRRLALSPA